MNNFAQAALVFGEQMHNDEVVKKAIHACNESLEVRTKDDNPLQWAATQNNLGSALFMLGKMNKEVGSLEGALEAFSQALEVYTAHGAERLAAITVKIRNTSNVSLINADRHVISQARYLFRVYPPNTPYSWNDRRYKNDRSSRAHRHWSGLSNSILFGDPSDAFPDIAEIADMQVQFTDLIEQAFLA